MIDKAARSMGGGEGVWSFSDACLTLLGNGHGGVLSDGGGPVRTFLGEILASLPAEKKRWAITITFIILTLPLLLS